MAPPPKTVTVPTPKFAPQEEAQMKGFFRRLGESIAGAGAVGGGSFEHTAPPPGFSVAGTGPAYPLAVALSPPWAVRPGDDVSRGPSSLRPTPATNLGPADTGPRASQWGHKPGITDAQVLEGRVSRVGNIAPGRPGVSTHGLYFHDVDRLTELEPWMENIRRNQLGSDMDWALHDQAQAETAKRARASGLTQWEQKVADYARRNVGLPVTASGEEVSSRLAAARASAEARAAAQGTAAWGAGGGPPPRGGAVRATQGFGPAAAAATILADPVSSSLGRRLAPNWTEQTQPRLTPGGLFQPEGSAFRDPLIQTQQDVEGLLAAIDRERGYREAEENIVNQQIMEEAAYGHPEAAWTGVAEFEPTYVEGVPSAAGRRERSLGERPVQVNPAFRLPHQLEAERAEEARLGRAREEWGRKWGTSGERRARIAELEASKRRLMEEEAGAGGGPAAVSPRLPGGGRTEQQQLQYYQNLMREIQRRAYLGGR